MTLIALQYALTAHGPQRRKGSSVPYITHPVAVSAILAQYGFDEDLVLAGVLHDVIEDAGVPPAEIAERFGPRVGRACLRVSEEKERGGDKTPWRERKETQLAHLREAEPEVLALKAAVKVTIIEQ